MPYVVMRQKPIVKKMTFEDVLFDLIQESELNRYSEAPKPTSNTKTYFVHNINHQKLNRIISSDINEMEKIYEMYKDYDIFFDPSYNYSLQVDLYREAKRELSNTECSPEDLDKKIEELVEKRLGERGYKMNKLYYTFYLPKKSGRGLRQIDAPLDCLASVQRLIKEMFERFMNYNTYHTSAYAYIPKRSRVDLVKKLQYNKSRWILKTDFSNFFGSIDINFAMRQLGKIYPFSEYVKTDRGYNALYNCLKFAFLDGRLPQGTPLSPLLTNIIMIPLDYKINKALYNSAKDITTFDNDNPEDERNYRLIYTRYADDIFIGSHRGFKFKPVIDFINQIIKEEDAPLVIKPEKTRYCSTAGRNWILGLMYNQDYNITVGHQRKKETHAMISNFCNDYKNGNMSSNWSQNDVEVLLGNISYVESIEPEYGKKMLDKYNAKFGFDVKEKMKDVAYCRV